MKLKEEQTRVIAHDGGELLVSASAGSGKTFTMIRRLIRLISSGKAKVSEILAVTFTEKAAAEMRAKLLDALLEEAAAGNAALAAQIADVYTADISTVHAFCGKLLRKYFFDAGLSPDFDIADEALASELKERALDGLFEELYEKKDEDFLLLASRHSRRRKDGELRGIVLSLYETARSEADFSGTLSKAEAQYTREKAEFFYGELQKPLLAAYAEYEEKFAAFAEAFKSLGEKKLESYARFLAERAQSLAKNKEGWPSLPSKTVTAEGAAQKEELSRERAGFFGVMEEYAALGEREEEIAKFLSCRRHTAALASLTQAFAAKYDELKRERNALDFSDLEHRSLALLENERVRADVRARYKYVFADEYQDTNGVQEAIFAAVSDGNLFMVGDLKQSIYAFRGCNPALFAEKERALKKTDAVRYLNHNFRTAPLVIDRVNEIFDHCMKADFSGVDYAACARLETGGTYGEHAGRFSVDVLQKSEEKAERRQAEVYDVLSHPFGDGEDFGEGDFIADLIEEEIGKPLYDPESDSERPVRYGDIAVLVRSRNRRTERIVRRLLARGIPVEAASGSVTDYAEILALLDALRLAENRLLDVPLASVLKNLYGFSDEDLASIRLYADAHAPKGGEKAAFCECCALCAAAAEEEETFSRLKEAQAHFARLSLYAEAAGAGEFLRAVLSDTSLELRIAASPDGARRLRRVERFVAEADASGCTVREFLQRIERSDGGVELSEAAGEDSVKIVTIHASKGLEYPVVFVAGLDGKFNFSDSAARIVKKREYGFAVPYYDDETKTVSDTIFRKFLKREVKKDTVREELRLFYVALTRAKYSLHLVGVNTVFGGEKVENAGKYAHFLPVGLPVNARGAGENGKRAETGRIIVEEKDEELCAMIGKNLAFCYPYAADTRLRLKTSVTAAAARFEEDDYNYLDFGEETNIERGIAMHKFMEHLDFGAKDAAAEIARMKREGLLAEEDVSLLDAGALQRLLDSGVFAMLDGYELYREQWFMANVPASLAGLEGSEIALQGIIDLLCVKGEEAVIVDYKYSSKDADSLARTYRGQLALYRYAAEKTLGLRVRACYLVSLAEAKIIAL